MHVCLWIGWSIKTSDHYAFCTIYGRVRFSFIKSGTQEIQYIINFNVPGAVSI